MWKMLGLMVAVGMLAGCAGMKPDQTYPHESFTAPMAYQEAYRRGEAHLRQCAPPVSLAYSGNIYTDNRTAVLRAMQPNMPNGDFIRIEIKALDAGQSHVTVSVIGRGIFDNGELAAARESIISGKVVCRKSKYQ